MVPEKAAAAERLAKYAFSPAAQASFDKRQGEIEAQAVI
jgi:hypothetical protein